MCEALGLYLPLSNTAFLTIHITPHCDKEDFSVIIYGVSNWIAALEIKYSEMPTVILNGDLKFPSMKSLSLVEILSFLDNLQDREARDMHIGTVTLQTKLLCNIVQDFYLHQIIEGHTRKRNLLDLFFYSDQYIILEHEIIDNVLFLEHTPCVIKTLIVLEPQK